MRILIDTRERKPLEFPGHRTSFRKLDAGDYSIYGGYDKIITVERKGIRDFLSWLSSRRVIPQLKKLRRCKYRCIVVEGDIDSTNPWTMIDKWTVARKTANIMAARVPVLFARNAKMAAHVVVSYLQACKDLVDAR